MRATLDHFEIPAADSERLAAFLESVLGWVAEDATGGSGDRTGPEPVSARYRRLAPVGEVSGSQPVVRVGLFEGSPEVLDRAVPVIRLDGEKLEACLDRVTMAGGRVLLEPMPVADSGRFARFADPEGNRWGLWEPSSDPDAPA